MQSICCPLDASSKARIYKRFLSKTPLRLLNQYAAPPHRIVLNSVSGIWFQTTQKDPPCESAPLARRATLTATLGGSYPVSGRGAP